MSKNSDDAPSDAAATLVAAELANTGTRDECMRLLASMRFGLPHPGILSAAVFRLAHLLREDVEAEGAHAAALAAVLASAASGTQSVQRLSSEYEMLQAARAGAAVAIAEAFDRVERRRERWTNAAAEVLAREPEPTGSADDDFDLVALRVRH